MGSMVSVLEDKLAGTDEFIIGAGICSLIQLIHSVENVVKPLCNNSI
jgi:hypothetical protein